MALKKRIKDVEAKMRGSKLATHQKAHLNALAKQYMQIQEDEKKIASEKAKVKKEIKTIIPQCLDKIEDDKGSIFIDVGDGLTIKHEKRVSVNLDQEKAVKYAENHNLINELTHTEIIADPESFEQLNLQGVISDKDLQNMTDIKETFALKVMKDK